jgi:hypothetical protein
VVRRTAYGFATLRIRGARLPIELLVQVRHIPDPDCLIAASRNQQPAIEAEREDDDEARVTAEVSE